MSNNDFSIFSEIAKKKVPINKQIKDCFDTHSRYLECTDKEERLSIEQELITKTSQVISYCLNQMMISNSRSKYSNGSYQNNTENDVLFANLLVLMDRKISLNRVPAPMAVSTNDVEVTLEINPLFLWASILDPIEDAFSESEIEQSLLSNDYEASQHYTNQIISILAHEALHIVYDHLALYSNIIKKGKHYATIMNYATDCTINQYLTNIPKSTITLDNIREMTNDENLEEKAMSQYYFQKLIEALPNPEDLENKLSSMRESSDDDSEEDDNSQSSGVGGKGKGKPLTKEEMESILEDISNALEGMSEEEIGEFKRALQEQYENHDWGNSEYDENGQEFGDSEVASNLARQLFENAIGNYEENKAMSSKGRGVLSKNLQERIDLIKEKTKMDWQQVLRQKIGTLAVPFKLSKNRVNRRQPNRPQLRGKIYDRLVKVTVAIDTSGSMSTKELTYILTEIYNILEAFPYELTVIEFDMNVNKVYTAKNFDEIETVLSGRGGTSYQPVFDYLYDNEYSDQSDVVIFATDGGGEQQVNTKYFSNLLWLLIGGNHLSIENPLGDIYVLDEDKNYHEWAKEN